MPSTSNYLHGGSRCSVTRNGTGRRQQGNSKRSAARMSDEAFRGPSPSRARLRASVVGIATTDEFGLNTEPLSGCSRSRLCFGSLRSSSCGCPASRPRVTRIPAFPSVPLERYAESSDMLLCFLDNPCGSIRCAVVPKSATSDSKLLQIASLSRLSRHCDVPVPRQSSNCHTDPFAWHCRSR